VVEKHKEPLMSSGRNVHRPRIIAGLLPLALAVAGCAIANDPGVEGIRIVATTSILGDIASAVVGEEGEVEVLIPIGVDSHEFQPSPQQVQLIAEADLVVANGLGLEPGIQDILDSAAGDGTRIIELAPLVDPLPFTEPGGNEEEEEQGSEDPHFWMDPIRVGVAALALADELGVSHPEGSWEERARKYATEMEATDQAVHDLVDPIPTEARLMVTNHEAFGYFAARYGFEVIGVVIPGGSTLAEPSSAEMAELVATMDHEGVQVIFAETSQPTVLAESIAAELGDDVEVVELYTESLGPPESGAETLSEMLLTNAERISAALG
jgi:zinc/manganese transport system substrate-binding protein